MKIEITVVIEDQELQGAAARELLRALLKHEDAHAAYQLPASKVTADELKGTPKRERDFFVEGDDVIYTGSIHRHGVPLNEMCGRVTGASLTGSAVAVRIYVNGKAENIYTTADNLRHL